jgi:hypothetical protein
MREIGIVLRGVWWVLVVLLLLVHIQMETGILAAVRGMWQVVSGSVLT